LAVRKRGPGHHVDVRAGDWLLLLLGGEADADGGEDREK
jgi:hypothetical protein